jgi:hypothetical protein
MARRAGDVEEGRGRRREEEGVGRAAGAGDDDEEEDDENDRRALLHQTREAQEEHLDALHASVVRLGEISKTISVELTAQDRYDLGAPLPRAAAAAHAPRPSHPRRIIDDINHDVAAADSKLEATSRRIKEFVDRNGA